jgi:hypothetical protein
MALEFKIGKYTVIITHVWKTLYKRVRSCSDRGLIIIGFITIFW